MPYFSKYKDNVVADGLAFSCSISNVEQPSLTLFKEEIERTCYNGLNLTDTKTENDLTYLSEQGVLLINCAFTTELNKSECHIKLWRNFVGYLIRDILNPYNRGLVFILLGSHAQRLEPLIDNKTHYILKASHPASASYTNGKWDCKDIFNKANEIISQNNGEEFKIIW